MNFIRLFVTMMATVFVVGCSTMTQQEFGSTYSIEQRRFDTLQVNDFTNAPQKAFSRARLSASPEVVFAKMADHENLDEWIPLINHKVVVDHSHSKHPGKNDVGTIRICNFGGDTLTERIQYWQPGRSYAYSVLPSEDNPATDHLGVITVESDGAGGSLVSWRQYFNPKPWSLKAKVMPLMMGMVMDKALGNLADQYGGEVL